MKLTEKRYKREWVLVCFFVLAITVLLSIWQFFPRLDARIYDLTIRLTQDRPASDKIVVIAIDDKSLEEIGAWPWRRSVHARLLGFLQEAKAVAFDISFIGTVPELAQENEVFANAIKNHQRVVLANFLSGTEKKQSNNPEPDFVKAAHGLGFININIEADGLIRYADLQHRQNGHSARHLSVAMLEAAGNQTLARQAMALGGNQKLGIPFAGPANHFQILSYTDVLSQRIPGTFFNNKYVFIGAWGTGLGDQYPTPTTSDSLNMSGVEILANMLQASLEEKWIQNASLVFSLSLNLLPILVLCTFLKNSSPRSNLALSILLTVAILLTHGFILYRFNLWSSPLPSILGIIIAYPLWSWRTQEVALYQMSREIAKVNKEEAFIFKSEIFKTQGITYNQSINQRFADLRGILTQVRNMRQFIMDNINQMPDATAVFDINHKLQFTTETTSKYLQKAGAGLPYKNQDLASFLEVIMPDDGQRAEVLENILKINTPAEPQSELLKILRDNGVETKDRINQDLLVKYVNTYSAAGNHIGYILTVHDISPIREAERKRENTLRFLSHDMRAPQSAIQALIELQKNPQTALPAEEILQRINDLSGRTIKLVEDFLQLTKAESMELDMTPVDLVELLEHIVNEYWGIRQKRNINVSCDFAEPIAFILGDHMLLSRAFINLIDNAFKYSADNTAIHCSIIRQKDNWQIRIKDQGVGISKENQERLFSSFYRVPDHESKISGMGLGLSFVKTV
ncbi:MAG: CHASE2 domain-containing protein, partial [Alcaligenaceae bacterium]|nr:CHASE2 domain-containing protein [Alcaligenaceae bacterium]